MNRSALIYFSIGMVITTASFAFFTEYMKMPQQMMIMPQQIMCPPCACNKD